MYKRIAVAVDGSKTSGAALDEAVKLAREMGANLMLLHVCEEMPIVWEPDGLSVIPMVDVVKAIVDAGKGLLEKYRKQLAGQGVTVETKLVETYAGRVGVAISEEARKWNADLLVVGTHGRTGIDRLLLGSVAEGISRSATMPVLLVRVND